MTQYFLFELPQYYLFELALLTQYSCVGNKNWIKVAIKVPLVINEAICKLQKFNGEIGTLIRKKECQFLLFADLYREIQLLKATIELQSAATNKDASFRH